MMCIQFPRLTKSLHASIKCMSSQVILDSSQFYKVYRGGSLSGQVELEYLHKGYLVLSPASVERAGVKEQESSLQVVVSIKLKEQNTLCVNRFTLFGSDRSSRNANLNLSLYVRSLAQS